MHIKSEFTDAAVLQILGERIQRYRIEAGLTQAELAEQAGIGKRTTERIEAGCGAELVTLIRVLRILNILEGLERLLPELPPSPIAQLELRGKQRQRVSPRRRQSEVAIRPDQVRGSSPARRWTWGVPHRESMPRAKTLTRTKRKR